MTLLTSRLVIFNQFEKYNSKIKNEIKTKIYNSDLARYNFFLWCFSFHLKFRCFGIIRDFGKINFHGNINKTKNEHLLLIHKKAFENKLCFYNMENWVGRGAKMVSFWVIKLLRTPEGAFDRV